MSRLKNWLRYARKHGLLAASRAFRDRWIYRSYRCVITYSVAAGPPVPDQIGDVRFRPATPSDYEQLREFEGSGRGERARWYVDHENDSVVVACHGDRIVGFRRASRVIRDSVVSRVVKLEPGQFWGADVFCLPEYRSGGIGRHLKVFTDRYMASLGYKEHFGSIDVTNIASLRASRAAGREAAYYISYLKVLFWERLRVSKDVPDHVWKTLK
jgi:GNAT superfamily N-acetyltransferase